MKHTEYVDDTVRNVALKLREMINDRTIRKTTGGKIEEVVVSVSIDNQTGKLYYGINGPKSLNVDPLTNPTRRLQCHQDLKPYMDSCKTHYDYDLNNCGEFNAINNALFDGANRYNISVYSIYIYTGNYAEPCLNCQDLYSEFASFIDFIRS